MPPKSKGMDWRAAEAAAERSPAPEPTSALLRDMDEPSA